ATGQMVRAEVDARVGGSFNFTDRRDVGDVEHVGEYLEIDRPRRLVFTFGVPKYSPAMTRVSVDIVPLDTGCELTLTHADVLPAGPERGDVGLDLDPHGLGLGLGVAADGLGLGLRLDALRLGLGRGGDPLHVGPRPRLDELGLAGPLGGENLVHDLLEVA